MQQVGNKNVLFGIATLAAMTLALLMIPSNDAVGDQQQVPFSNLSDADIDMIIAVKQEMAAVRAERAAR
jgi:hypothetical protein